VRCIVVAAITRAVLAASLRSRRRWCRVNVMLVASVFAEGERACYK